MHTVNNNVVANHIDALRGAGPFGEFSAEVLVVINDGLDALGKATTFEAIAEALGDIGAFAASVAQAGSGDELVNRLNRIASYDPGYFGKVTAGLLPSLRKALDG